jgi:integrase
MPKLTKRIVDATNTTDREIVAWDEELPGFGLRVKKSGAKSFIVQYRNRNGRSRRLTIGRYGVLTPDCARREAKAALAEVTRGFDPVESRQSDRAARTMAELCRDYLAKADAGLLLTRRRKAKCASTLYTDRGRIERHIIPLLGHRTVKDLTSSDVRAFMRDVIAGKTAADVKTKKHGRARVTGGRGTASRTMGLLGAILNFAVEEEYRPDNPARGIVRPKDEKRKARLDDEGYRTLGQKLREAEEKREPWQAVEAIRALVLTGCRRGEIEGLRHSELDLAGRVLRLGSTKTGTSVRPLGRAAADVLRASRERAGEGSYVFPALRERTDEAEEKKGKGPYRGLPKAWRRIIGDSLPGMSPHGLRHSFASLADDLGLSEPTIGALLGHARHGTTAGYIHKLDPTLLAAADRVSSRIAALLGNEKMGVVVQLPVSGTSTTG